MLLLVSLSLSMSTITLIKQYYHEYKHKSDIHIPEPPKIREDISKAIAKLEEPIKEPEKVRQNILFCVQQDAVSPYDEPIVMYVQNTMIGEDNRTWLHISYDAYTEAHTSWPMGEHYKVECPE